MRGRMAWCAAICLAANVVQAEPTKYSLGPDSQRKEGVQRGTVTKHVWKSQIFEGTIREYQVYVPAQADGKTPLPVMVFQDGHAYASETGQFRVPVVFDNLIHAKEIPPLVGVFINPGHKGDELPKDAWKPSNRSFEYDTLSDQYARFLLEEILPEVGKTVPLAKDASQRAICGISSGGICAWTVAWERPQEFGKVLSHVGSFTNIRGGHACQALVRKTPKKPIRVYLQANEFDLNNEHGNWWLANLEMESSLKFAKYDVQFVGGKGAHNGEFGGSVLPDALRWLWRPAD